jgi:hypothetical protein
MESFMEVGQGPNWGCSAKWKKRKKKLVSTASVAMRLLKKKDEKTPVIKPHAMKTGRYPFSTSVLNIDQ